MSRFTAYFGQTARGILYDPLRRFQASLLLVVLLFLIGTVGYIILEGWTPVEALYMTVITVATVGFGEVRELSEPGRIFTIFLILLGVGAVTTAISNAVTIILGPLLWSTIQRNRMEALVMKLDNHYIVCGYGRMGRQIVRDLQARGEAFVIVDMRQEIQEHLLEEKLPHVIGDATADESLIEARVDKARGLVAALSSDAGNVMTVLTARELNPKLFIVARVVRVESESKLRRAGANHVINPYQIGGHRMALSLMRPAVHDFLTRIFHFGEGLDIDIGQITVRPGARLDGQTIGKCDLRGIHNLNILGIISETGDTVITPSPATLLVPGMVLIVIGSPEAIYQLERAQV